jgi:hypothetical protein
MDMIDDVHAAPPAEPPVSLAGIVDPFNILEPGVYFGLDEDTYHSSFGLSSSGIKDFRVSPLTWWSKSSLNPRQAEVLEELSSSEAKELGTAFDARIICGKDYFNARYVPQLEKTDGVLVTDDDLKTWLTEKGLPTKGKRKQERIDRVLEADPTAKIWDVILDGYIKQHEGKTLLDPKWMAKIELAAAMIESHPEYSKALKGGAPQVSVIWNCPVTGIPCRARFDYLKTRAIFDLKTFEPRGDLPLEAAIGKEIGFRRYYIQACFYVEAAAQIPGFIRDGKVYGDAPPALLDALSKNASKAFGWLFQIKGPAPQAFGYMLPPTSMLWNVGNAEIDHIKHSFRAHLDKFGALPWVDPTGFKNLDDANVPPWALI